MRRRVIQAFTRRHGCSPDFVIRAPGRVNLIGEHTDYNQGLVLPVAIDRALWMAGRKTHDGAVRLESLDQPGPVVFERGDAEPGGAGGPSWGRYVWAVASLLSTEQDDGVGLEGVLGSELPVGAGLSSSAALELATARALQQARGKLWEAQPMSLLCHRAENEGVGVPCGAMDQLVVGAARRGSALKIDCRTMESTHIQMPAGLVVAVLDTGTRRALEQTGYREVRAQCEAAAEALGVTSLRDVDLETLEASHLEGPLLQRARHVVTENHRVVLFARALAEGESAALGALFAASHRSLRDDLGVVTPALDAIVGVARAAPGCLGARMTGAGFGGCAVALVDRASAHVFRAVVESGYARRSQLPGQVLLCEAADGVGLDDGWRDQ
jgi:galactokinase